MLYDLWEDDTALFLCRYLLYNEDIRAKEKEIWEFEKEYFEIEEIFKDIEFLNLQEPKIREIDRCWAKILYSDKSEDKLNEAVQLLSFIANKRNSKRIK